MKMAKLVYADLLKALPEEETRSSYNTYRSYLNKLGLLGYKDGADIMVYMDDPYGTCEKLQDAGMEMKDCVNLCKALKFLAGKANKFLKLDIDMRQLENYKTDIIEKVYGGGRRQENSDDAVTDIEEDIVPDLNMKRVVSRCADLERRQNAMTERMFMMERMVLELAKSVSAPGVTELLYRLAMQTFDT
jgi:hypothetical protein